MKSSQYLIGRTISLLLLIGLAGSAHAQAGGAAGYTQFVMSTRLSVFSDGSASVNQTLLLPQNVTSLGLPLFSKQVADVLAVNKDGSPLSYSINGGNITLYTLGATRVVLTYETDALTSKQGAVWDLKFYAPSNMSLILPFQSTILSFSGTPTSLSTSNGDPMLVLAEGSWQISYGLPLTTSTSTKSSSTNATPSTTLESPLAIAAIVGSVGVVGTIAVLLKRGKLGGGMSSALRFDDREILRFVKEKGGRAIEAEIREHFSLPRTSAWRQAKRLERLGFVKISKLGTQNQVELVRGDFEGQL